MERHYQHTSPFPPEFRTTHNFFTKEVFVMPLHPVFFRVERADSGGGTKTQNGLCHVPNSPGSFGGYVRILHPLEVTSTECSAWATTPPATSVRTG